MPGLPSRYEAQYVVSSHRSTNDLEKPIHPSQLRAPTADATRSSQLVERQAQVERMKAPPVEPHSVQEEDAGYMSTESDTDTVTDDRVQV